VDENRALDQRKQGIRHRPQGHYACTIRKLGHPAGEIRKSGHPAGEIRKSEHLAGETRKPEHPNINISNMKET